MYLNTFLCLALLCLGDALLEGLVFFVGRDQIFQPLGVVLD